MKNAITAAVVAAIVAGGSTAAASSFINGSSIRPHSIPLNRLAGNLPAGPVGPQGATGATGLIDPSRLTLVDSATRNVAAGGADSITADCPAEDRATGGGFFVIGSATGVDAQGAAPEPDLSGWTTAIINYGKQPASIRAYAVCVGS